MECVTEVEWYVVFTDQEVQPHWIHPFLKREFHHCYCFREIGDLIYFANPTISNIDSKIYAGVDILDLATNIKRQPHTKILKFKYPFDFRNRVFNTWNMAPTCVSVVKMFLGISAKAQTPYQLYRHLIQEGAVSFNN